MTTNRTLGTPCWEWLLAVPLLHQLQYPAGIQVVCIDPEKPDWGISGLDREKLWMFRDHVQNKQYMYLSMQLATYIIVVILDHINLIISFSSSIWQNSSVRGWILIITRIAELSIAKNTIFLDWYSYVLTLKCAKWLHSATRCTKYPL